MIKYQTVLVLGAGSSAEVGLPTGAKLAQDLTGALDIRFKGGSDIVSGNQDIALALAYAARRADGPKADINEYFHAARRISAGVGLTSSIDTFIDVHRDNPLIARCGKIAIVQAILDAERSSSLHIDRQTTNKVEGPLFERATSSWFFQLARMLFDGLAKAKLDEVFAHLCVINFNYDRCLEHLPIHALSAAYGVETAHARQLVDKLRIWHPYGTVGLLSSTVDDQTQLATFGDKKTPEAVAVLALLWHFGFSDFSEEHFTMRASQGWRLHEEVEDGLPDGGHARLWWRSCDSFFSVPLL